MDGLYIGFILILILLAVCIFFIIKFFSNIARARNNMLEIADGKYICTCRHMSGLPELTENISCYMFADDKKITIVPTDNKNVKIYLQLSKIKKFQNIHEVEPLSSMQQEKENNKIVIQYESENGVNKELVFSLVANISKNTFNNDDGLDFFWLTQYIGMMDNNDNC